MRVFIAFATFVSLPVWAQSAPAQNLMSVAMSLALVIVIIICLAALVKRFTPNMPTMDEFKVIRSIPLGSKERLLVVEIDNKQHLLGVTPHAINYLYELENPLAAKEMPALAKSFSQILNPNNKKI
ncbi:flagellar protein FliO/FliZ [Pseudoalteromonas ulvae UL12]|uniref:Flagellar protein n=1 Tax=Pseudoalteromonas ulvae TaxID=107327 RepID=A0A244CSG5_PSEDV|nr:flagellar biosynthetic protein FliO [Pseudoalteromonas ulvae]MBE0363711.1 flagellar protein FliO/FliZ [Pseudoalteromonas ulvae UL12]OUL58557.1 flagellar biosynthetic protein FliO [Pseudoalteromonas ulvae]